MNTLLIHGLINGLIDYADSTILQHRMHALHSIANHSTLMNFDNEFCDVASHF